MAAKGTKGRPSKLSDFQWAEIGRRLALGGDGNTVSDLSKEFKVSKSTISQRFSKRVENIQVLATTLATTEKAIEALPFSERCSVRTLADQLKGIAGSLATAAAANAKVSEILAEAAKQQAGRIVTENGYIDVEQAKATAALVGISNEAGKLGMGLLTANKDKGNTGAPTLEELVTGGGK